MKYQQFNIAFPPEQYKKLRQSYDDYCNRLNIKPTFSEYIRSILRIYVDKQDPVPTVYASERQ